MIGPALAIGILVIIGLTTLPAYLRSRREDKHLDQVIRCGPGCICAGENTRTYSNAMARQNATIYAQQQAGQTQEAYARQLAQQPIIIHQPQYQPQPEPAPIIVFQAPAPAPQQQRQVIVVPAPQAQPQQPQIHYLQPPQASYPPPQYHPDYLAQARENYRREVEGYYTENGQPIMDYQPEALPAPQRRALPPPSQQPQATTAARKAWAKEGRR